MVSTVARGKSYSGGRSGAYSTLCKIHPTLLSNQRSGRHSRLLGQNISIKNREKKKKTKVKAARYTGETNFLPPDGAERTPPGYMHLNGKRCISPPSREKRRRLNTPSQRSSAYYLAARAGQGPRLAPFAVGSISSFPASAPSRRPAFRRSCSWLH